MRKENEVKMLSPEMRRELKELFIKTERSYLLAQSTETRYIAQDIAGEFVALAFGTAPFEYKELGNEVKTKGFEFWIHQGFLPKRLVYRTLGDVINFRDKLKPRTVYKFRKFSDREIAEMMQAEELKAQKEWEEKRMTTIFQIEPSQDNLAFPPQEEKKEMTGLGNIDDVYKHYLKIVEENKELKDLLRNCKSSILFEADVVKETSGKQSNDYKMLSDLLTRIDAIVGAGGEKI